MKILLTSSSSGSRGGGELYLIYLGRSLSQRGHEVILWTSKHPRMDALAESFAAFGQLERSDYSNTYDRPFRSIGAFLDRPTAHRISNEWKRIAPDLIHLNKQNLEDSLDLLCALRITELPSLCTIHLTQSARYLRAVLAPVRDFVSRRSLSLYAGMLVTVLENRRRDLEQFLGTSSRIQTIPNGVPLFDLSQREHIRSEKRLELGITNEKLVVAVGRMVPQKRPLVFLEHAAAAIRRHPGIRFLWIGDGTLANEWDRRVADLQLQQTVQRLPWQGDVTPYLFAADLFLHVAEFEGLPLAILEAMSAGLPCAVANHLLDEMPFLDSKSAITVGQDASWTDALTQPDLLRDIGANARTIAERLFSFEMMAERYETLYHEVIANCS